MKKTAIDHLLLMLNSQVFQTRFEEPNILMYCMEKFDYYMKNYHYNISKSNVGKCFKNDRLIGTRLVIMWSYTKMNKIQ